MFPSFSVLKVRPDRLANYSTPLSILCFRLSGALTASTNRLACRQLRLETQQAEREAQIFTGTFLIAR
jgi:hypothetical protein